MTIRVSRAPPWMNPRPGSLLRRATVLSTAAYIAYDLSRICGIKLYDLFVPRSLSGADVRYLRSVISNFVVSLSSDFELQHNGFDPLIAHLLDLNRPRLNGNASPTRGRYPLSPVKSCTYVGLLYRGWSGNGYHRISSAWRLFHHMY
jgi:hypothetical protein